MPENEAVFHYLHDILGSVVALTDSAGRVVERYTYDPYGEPAIEPTDPATGLPLTDVGGEPRGGGGSLRLAASGYGNPFLWTGQRYDAGVRLYHFLYRGYSPRLGRWLQRDPLGYVDGISLYQYVRSGPLGWVDPLGLFPGTYSFPEYHGPGGVHIDTEWHDGVGTGSVHVQFGKKKYYYDPTTDTFTDKDGNTLSNSQKKFLKRDPKFQRGLDNGVERLRKQGKSRIKTGPTTSISLSIAAWLTMFYIQGEIDALDYMSRSPIYRRLLQAIKDGDLELANQLHDKLLDKLFDEQLILQKLAFEDYWRNEIFPKLKEELEKIRRERCK